MTQDAVLDAEESERAVVFARTIDELVPCAFGSNARLDVGLLGGAEAVCAMIDTREENLYIGDPSGGETRTELVVPTIGISSRRANRHNRPL